MEKELLTKGRIKADLQQMIFSRVPAFLIMYFVLAPITYLLLKIPFVFFTNNNFIVLLTFNIAFAIVFLKSFIKDLIFIIAFLKQLKNSSFTITTDCVVEKLHIINSNSTKTFTKSRPHTFVFAKCGKYGIPHGINYKWSKLYAMNGETLYRFTDLKDDFYVISIEKKPVLAYNKRYFELNE